MAVTILSRKIPTYAKESCTVSASDIQNWCDVECLLNDGLQVKNYGTLEVDFFRLDGTFDKMPYLTQDYGYWSGSISNNTGGFDSAPVLTFIFAETYSSNGITLWFDTYNNDYCNNLSVSWYTDDNLISTVSAVPDSAYYYIRKDVDGFNKIVVEFKSMNKPNRYLKLFRVDFGESYLFTDSMIEECKVYEEIDLSRLSVPSNECNFIVNSINTNMFRNGMQIDVFHNSDYIGMFFVVEFDRLNSQRYKVDCLDIFATFSETDWHKTFGVQNRDSVEEVVKILCDNKYKVICNTPMNNGFGKTPVLGARELLVLAAINNWVYFDCSRSNKIIIDTEKPNKTDISGDRIKSNGALNEKTFYKGVDLTISVAASTDSFVSNIGHHTFSSYDEELLVNEYSPYLYPLAFIIRYGNGSDTNALHVAGGVGWIVVKANPKQSLSNIYKIDAEYGRISKDTTYTLKNDKLEGEIYKTKIPYLNIFLTVETDVLLQNVYNHYVNEDGTGRKTFKFDMELKNEKCGDRISFPTEYMGTQTGIIQSISMDLKTSKNIASVEVYA